MKVTTILPDDLIADIKSYAKGKNLTESLITALNDWRYHKRVEELNRQLNEEPIEFNDGFSAEKIRKMNNRYDHT